MGVSKGNNTKKTSAIISAILLFYISQPYFVWSPILQNLYLRILLVFILAGLFFMNKKVFDKADKFLFLFFVFTAVVYGATSGNNIFFFIAFFPVVLLPFANQEYSQKVFDVFLKIYCVFISLALISWLLSLVGAISPYKMIPPLNPLKPGNYYVFPFMVSEHNPVERFFGVYDEPGVVGTISALLLCINNLNMRKMTSWILLISGLCSQSLFFYIILGLYALGYAMTLSRKLSTKIFWIAAIVVGGGVITRVPALQERITERLEWDESKGSFAGDNRINANVLDIYVGQLQGASLLWGIPNKRGFMEDAEGASSIWLFIIVNGIVFISLYALFFILYAVSRSKNVWRVLLFTSVFIGTIYQRPYIFNALFVFLFCCLASQTNDNWSVKRIEEHGKK